MDSIANTSVIQIMTVVIEAHNIAETTNPGVPIRNLITDIKQVSMDPKNVHLGGLVHSISPSRAKNATARRWATCRQRSANLRDPVCGDVRWLINRSAS